MENYEWIDRIASAGAIIIAFALSCCLPLFGIASASLGLTFLHSESALVPFALQFLYILALAGSFSTFRKHKSITPLLLIVLGNVLVFYAYYFNFLPVYIYIALASLVAGSVVNYFASRKCQCNQNGNEGIELESEITCPNCNHKQIEKMRTDSCQFFYVCPACKKNIRPKEGDCCVFCSYGSQPCPIIQKENK